MPRYGPRAKPTKTVAGYKDVPSATPAQLRKLGGKPHTSFVGVRHLKRTRLQRAFRKLTGTKGLLTTDEERKSMADTLRKVRKTGGKEAGVSLVHALAPKRKLRRAEEIKRLRAHADTLPRDRLKTSQAWKNRKFYAQVISRLKSEGYTN